MKPQLDPAVFSAAISEFLAEGIPDATEEAVADLLEDCPALRELIESWSLEIRLGVEETVRVFLAGLTLGWDARGAIADAAELERLLQ